MIVMTSTNCARWKMAALVASFTSIVLCAASVDAQTDVVIPSLRARSCLDTVSLKPSKQMLVYLSGAVADSTDPAFGEMGDLFVQSVSQRMRSRLGGSGSDLPRSEPTITWRDAASHAALRVIVHREGAPTFTLVNTTSPSKADLLLLRVATDAQAAGDGVYWPSTTRGDSAEYTIGFALPSFGQVFPMQLVRTIFPTFLVLFPPFTPTVSTSTTAPADPFAGTNSAASAKVVTSFEVDSTGHVVPSTIAEVWPAGKQHPTGTELDTYRSFLNSVIQWLPTATFEPARIGGCPVSQFMRLPITFGVKGPG